MSRPGLALGPMAEDAVIRPAGPADAEAIARVHVRSWQVAYEHIFGRDTLAALSVEERRRAWLPVLAAPGPGAVTLVAEEAGEMAGFAGGGPPRDADLDPARTVELYAIYLAPERWGSGIGSLLMEALLERLAAGGPEEVVLWVLEDNARARRFYERAGWRADGAVKTDEHLGASVREVRYRVPCRSP